MNESNYCECVVPRKSTTKDFAIKGILITLASIVTVLGVAIPILLFVAAIGWYLIFTFWARFQVVYEYVFVDGQIDFDRILGGSVRKSGKRIDMDTVTLVAPERSHALDGYKHLQTKPIDYTSLDPERSNLVYVIINKGDKDTEIIRFEPDENLIAHMKKKAPRKVEEY
ncbi:MAG: hypothetical protein J6Y26_04090 [Lachnospiraceae bacterium]|nr:hypothetical protein [Lachnospiraceae bacterium]